MRDIIARKEGGLSHAKPMLSDGVVPKIDTGYAIAPATRGCYMARHANPAFSDLVVARVSGAATLLS